MDHAWLDSLSEDWVSQPRSSGSPVPSLPSLPSLSSSTPDSLKVDAKSSRIPRFDPEKQIWSAPGDNVLSERSINNNNVPQTRRSVHLPSKLREETSNDARGRKPSQSFSASSTSSTNLGTVAHKSTSLSPRRNDYQTPEWKRRLLQGEVAYGEQRDLFSPAGLENIFRPPLANDFQNDSMLPLKDFQDESVMPSSPPPYYREGITNTNPIEPQEISTEKLIPRREKQSRTMAYHMVDSSNYDISADVLSVKGDGPCNSKTIHTVVDSSGFISLQAQPHIEGNRGVSGQSELRNEEFSPVLVPSQASVKEKTCQNSISPGPKNSHSSQGRNEENEHKDHTHNLSKQKSDVTLPTGLDARFIDLHRGGYAHEGSFQKRMLSLSSLPGFDESAMLPEESIQASTPKTIPTADKSRTVSTIRSPNHGSVPPSTLPSGPTTPQASPKKSAAKSNSGSPLKLFGNYDTFTNQKLLRRLSQFEINHTHAQQGEKVHTPKTRDVSKQMGNFGEGDFDDFEFSEERSYHSSSDLEHRIQEKHHSLQNRLATKDAWRLERSSTTVDQESLEQHTIERVAIVSLSSRGAKNTQRTTHHVAKSFPAGESTPSSPMTENLRTPRKREGGLEGKRLPKSPLKDSTPKRRRTLQKPDFSERNDSHVRLENTLLGAAHEQMQSIIGKKRKDARPGNHLQAANPQVLAMRQMLRPRTPTPSQRTSSIQQPSSDDTHEINSRDAHAQAKRIAEVQAQLDAPVTQDTSTAVAFSQQIHNDMRKGSVTTQDFLNEAKKIMAGIRGKVRSGLASLEESEAENDRNVSTRDRSPEPEFDESYQESTQEPFSRPPSREGKPVMNLRKEQNDPALLDHLRKYQEKSELELALASSVKLHPTANENVTLIQLQHHETNHNVTDHIATHPSTAIMNDAAVISDPPNIFISENPDLHRKRKHSTSSVTPATEDFVQHDYPSHGSNSSSDQSTARSIPTGSSRGSDSKHIIAPHTVSHLIPEQLAGMFLDKERNIWIKRKPVEALGARSNFLPSDESEEDPFGDIPDLSVDETQELRRLKAVAAKQLEQSLLMQIQPETTGNDHFTPSELVYPVNGGERHISLKDGLTVVEATQITSTNDHTTRTKTSHISHIKPEMLHIPHQSVNSLPIERKPEDIKENEIDTEISILEDRVAASPPLQRRNVTISFSSPLTHVISSTSHEDQRDIAKIINRDLSDGQPIQVSGTSMSNKGHTQRAHNSTLRSALRSGTRQISLSGRLFVNRPVSRIEEHDENISPDQARHSGMDIITSTPLPSKRETSLVIATPQQADQFGNLSLTPLSEFTVHQVDRSFGMDISYVEKGRREVLGTSTKRTLSLSIKQLVEKITQVEPYEPFWEHLQQLDLKDKRLTTLHKLDEFCEHLVELDASCNQISQLDGVPSSVRDLRVSYNQITDLAPWGHLINLQYIDVSNNQIESLASFRNLHHLRGLRADNNKIKSLDGILQLSGLIQLRARENQIDSLDFARTKLQRLTDLDLRSNNISSVQTLHELGCLSSLNLEDNDLSELIISQPMRALRYLKLSNNNLEKLDISRLPDLRLLYVDENRLESVKGLLKTKYLDTLSMREQQEGTYIEPSFLSHALEIRKLFLSGNLLTTFQPQVEYLNLQYLELANCGIEALSPEFGYMIPNVRVLNLNFNALRDIRPLAGIARLKRLYLVGNRLLRLRSTTALISKMPTLSLVDLRNNPFTQGFYPAAVECRTVVQEVHRDAESSGQPFLLKAGSREEDAKYVRRLDQQTKIMRRLFEIMVLNGCSRLKTLDGLTVDRDILVARDDVWEGLVSAGILKTDDVVGSTID